MKRRPIILGMAEMDEQYKELIKSLFDAITNMRIQLVALNRAEGGRSVVISSLEQEWVRLAEVRDFITNKPAYDEYDGNKVYDYAFGITDTAPWLDPGLKDGEGI